MPSRCWLEIASLLGLSLNIELGGPGLIRVFESWGKHPAIPQLFEGQSKEKKEWLLVFWTILPASELPASGEGEGGGHLFSFTYM